MVGYFTKENESTNLRKRSLENVWVEYAAKRFCSRPYTKYRNLGQGSSSSEDLATVFRIKVSCGDPLEVTLPMGYFKDSFERCQVAEKMKLEKFFKEDYAEHFTKGELLDKLQHERVPFIVFDM